LTSVITSDLHLKISRKKEDYRDLEKFLESVKPVCSDLYILGDMYMYWFEHPNLTDQLYNPGLSLLKNFSKSGRRVHFIYGNRDFTAGDYFKKHSGVHYVGKSAVLRSGEKNVFFEHGDGLAKRDVWYQLWRFFIRSPVSFFVFKRLPAGAAITLVDKIKKIGKNNAAADRVIAEMITEGAENVIKNYGYDSVVAGHAHLKYEKFFKWEKKTREIYIVPEFNFPGEFLVLERGRFEYRRFS